MVWIFVILEGAGGQTMFYRGCEKIQDPKDHCEKTTVAQLGSASKCHCLGDGCNSASRLKSYFGIAFSILAIIMFRWKYTKYYIINISSSYGRTPHIFRVCAQQKVQAKTFRICHSFGILKSGRTLGVSQV